MPRNPIQEGSLVLAEAVWLPLMIVDGDANDTPRLCGRRRGTRRVR
jgi:hypothetical protein